MAAGLLFRRRIAIPLKSKLNSPILSWVCNLCSGASTKVDIEKESKLQATDSSNYLSRMRVASLFEEPSRINSKDFKMELVDPDTWLVSSGLSEAWRGTHRRTMEETQSSISEMVDEPRNYASPIENEPDIDEIEDMRIRGKLFYKLDKDSREFEEYNFDFHRKKSSKKKIKENPKENKKKENNLNSSSKGKTHPKLAKNKPNTNSLEEINSSFVNKKLRTPTFNQITGAYHEPFCLDIYISKSSVRACIVHRVTSKVVVVAHSISKDMKFDLVSTKNSTACEAVGGVLAQRALADDIHDVVYTPRKGEKLEGKLQIVLQSVIDNGINVKVKIKQRKYKQGVISSK